MDDQEGRMKNKKYRSLKIVPSDIKYKLKTYFTYLWHYGCKKWQEKPIAKEY